MSQVLKPALRARLLSRLLRNPYAYSLLRQPFKPALAVQ